MSKYPKLSPSLNSRLGLHLTLKERLLEQQGSHLREVRAALEREHAVVDLLSDLLDESGQLLAPGAQVSGISLNNCGQFKKLLYNGLVQSTRQSRMLQQQCIAATEELLICRRQVHHLKAVLLTHRQERTRKRERRVNEDWLIHARNNRAS